MTVIQRIDAQGCGCDAPEHLASLISIDEALRRIAQHAAPVAGTEAVPLFQASGRVLAEAVLAASMAPPFDNAAMDGYAVATAAFAGDGPWRFPVVARIAAGEAPPARIAGAAAARIFTGAPVPRGADAVVRQEDVSRTGSTVTFRQRPAPGLNIRRAGGDMRPGQVVLESGARLGPREIAACAAAGAGTVQVRRTLRAGLLVTGREVREAGSGRDGAQIWDVNTPMLCAAIGGPAISLVCVTQVSDNRAALERSLERMAGSLDLIVTTGGVSVGGEDHVKPAMKALGTDILFSGVAIKPGKPVTYGRAGDTHWLGLPGNPLAAFVTWQLFGTALAGRLAGQRRTQPARRHVVTAEPIRRKPGRCEFRPASLAGFDSKGREVVRFEDATHSGRVGRLPASGGLLVLPADCDELPAGALAEFLPFCDN